MWEFLDDMAHCMGRVVEGIDLCKDTIVSLMGGKPADRYMYMDSVIITKSDTKTSIDHISTSFVVVHFSYK
jgi:hypothetical protein